MAKQIFHYELQPSSNYAVRCVLKVDGEEKAEAYFHLDQWAEAEELGEAWSKQNVRLSTAAARRKGA
jgi:hypothetical protein